MLNIFYYFLPGAEYIGTKIMLSQFYGTVNCCQHVTMQPCYQFCSTSAPSHERVSHGLCHPGNPIIG